MNYLLCFPKKGPHMGTTIERMTPDAFPYLEKYLEMSIYRVVVVENGKEFFNPSANGYQSVKGRQLDLFKEYT